VLVGRRYDKVESARGGIDAEEPRRVRRVDHHAGADARRCRSNRIQSLDAAAIRANVARRHEGRLRRDRPGHVIERHPPHGRAAPFSCDQER
jgi:hypothetical protein